MVYPASQPAILWGTDASPNLTRAASGYLALRSTLPPEQMIHTLSETVAQVDPLLALHDVKPMTAAISNVEAPRTLNPILIAAFALGALLLSVAGIYAVVAFNVSLRSQEIAIRMAPLGWVLGIAAALAMSRLVASFLFEVRATNPFLYAGGAALMILMALLASIIPALKARRPTPPNPCAVPR